MGVKRLAMTSGIVNRAVLLFGKERGLHFSDA